MVSSSLAQRNNGGVARIALFNPVGIGGDNGPELPANTWLVTFEPDQRPRRDNNRSCRRRWQHPIGSFRTNHNSASEADIGGEQTTRGACGDNPGETIPLAHGMQFGCARGQDQCIGMQVKKLRAIHHPDDNQRPRVCSYHFQPICHIEHGHVATRLLKLLCRFGPAPSTSDHNNITMSMFDARCGASPYRGSARLPDHWVAPYHHARAHRRLAGPNPSDPINFGDTVSTVARKAQGTPVGRLLP